jgi:autotransporter adhesin
MKKVQGLAIGKMLFAALSISLILAGIAQAQLGLPTFTGKFRLTNQVQWDKTVLQPGDYTITIESIGTPAAVLIRDSKGRPVARLISGIDDGKTSARNALLLKEKGGQLRVYSLALASLGKVLVYDPALAREAVMEARAPQTVPVMLAKR